MTIFNYIKLLPKTLNADSSLTKIGLFYIQDNIHATMEVLGQ